MLALVSIVAIALVVVGLVAVLGGSDDEQATPQKPASESVDISDLDDPATSPPKAATTTSATTTIASEPGERVRVVAESGVAWTMASEPVERDVLDEADLSSVIGSSWRADAGGATTEVVELRDLGGAPIDTAGTFTAIAAEFDGDLSEIKDSHIATADGLTASFEGTLDSGEPVVGYLVAAQVDDRSLLVMVFREDDDLQGLYLDFLKLPSSVDLE